MIKKYQITQEEYEAILDAISETMSTSGLSDKDSIEATYAYDGYTSGTSMCWDTFKESLKNQFIIK